MSEVEIRLEREDQEGIVAVASYLADALKRLGVAFEGPCGRGKHFCAVHIVEGGEHLSTPTQVEREHLATPGVSHDERLACQVKIDGAGRLVVMTKEKQKKEEQKAEEDHSERYKKEFAEMPLDKKISNLVHLEALTLSETISFVVNSPLKIVELAMDVMADFGLKLDRESKNAKRPEEHKAKQGTATKNGSSKPGKSDNKGEKAKKGV